LRDSAGITPDFARSRCPDVVRSTPTIASNPRSVVRGSIGPRARRRMHGEASLSLAA